MAENQEKGQKTKSRIKATEKDVWADEEIDMLFMIHLVRKPSKAH